MATPTVSTKAAKLLGMEVTSVSTPSQSVRGGAAERARSVFVIVHNESYLGFANTLEDAQRLACAIALNNSSDKDPSMVSNAFSTPFVLMSRITNRGYLYNTTTCNVYVIKEVRQSPCALDAVVQQYAPAISKIMATAIESATNTSAATVVIAVETTPTIPTPPPMPSKPLIDANTVWLTMPPSPPPLPRWRMAWGIGSSQ